MKMIYYKPIKRAINTPGLAEVINNMIIPYYSLLNLIINDCDLVFILKFWFLLYYFLTNK